MDTAVMSALCRLPVADFDYVVRRVLTEGTGRRTGEQRNKSFGI